MPLFAVSKRSAALILALAYVSYLMSGAANSIAAAALVYPPAHRDAQVDDYHGTQVADPYRWLEDIDSPEARAWVAAQGDLSRKFLDSIAGRESMTQRLRDVWNFERWTPPVRHGESWFYTHNDGLQNQSVVYVMSAREALDPAGAQGQAKSATAGRILLDPNTLSADGTVALNGMSVSADGKLLAYALSEAGSDWQTWRVRDVDTGKDLPDTLLWSKEGSASWRKDGSGFYYTAYDAPKEGAALKAGFKAATGDIVVMLDADGSMNPDEIILLVGALLAGADFVKGSRFVEGGGSSDLSAFRTAGNLGLTLVTRLLYGCRFSDLCYGYMAFWTRFLPVLDSSVSGFEIESLLCARALHHRLKIVEVPSFESERLHGVSNLRALPDGWRVLTTIVRERFAVAAPSVR